MSHFPNLIEYEQFNPPNITPLIGKAFFSGNLIFTEKGFTLKGNTNTFNIMKDDYICYSPFLGYFVIYPEEFKRFKEDNSFPYQNHKNLFNEKLPQAYYDAINDININSDELAIIHNYLLASSMVKLYLPSNLEKFVRGL